MKKWSYAAAMMLALAGGSMLTGCIDNDEPFGIKEVRLATAELLKAKAAAADAAQATANANVQMAQIQAEVDKLLAQAELVRANSEAEVNKILAQAAAAKDDAEAAVLNAQAQAILDESKAKCDKIAAEVAMKQQIVDQLVNEAKIKIAELERQYNVAALEDAESAKSAKYAELDAAYTRYLGALKALDKEIDELKKAQQTLANSKIDLQWQPTYVEVDGKWVENGGSWVSPNYDAKAEYKTFVANLAKKQANVEKAIAKLEEAKTVLENLEASDAYAQLEKYQAELKENELALEEVRAEKQQIQLDSIAVKKAWEDAQAALQDTLDVKRPIPAYTFVPSADLAALGMTEEKEVVAEGETYTLSDNNGSYDASQSYTDAEDAYNNQIASIKNFLMDDFDKAWTNARVNELSNMLTAANTEYAAAEKAWNTAKGIYNNGKTPVIPSDLAGEADYEAAMKAYNDAIANVEATVEAYNKAKENDQAKEDAYNEELDKFENENPNTALAVYTQAFSDYRTAMNEASENYNAACAAASEQQTVSSNALAQERVTLETAKDEALKVYNALNAQLALDPTSSTLKTQVANAKGDYEKAQKAYDLFVIGDPTATPPVVATSATKALEIQNTYDKAIAAAETAKAKAEEAAKNALAKAELTYQSSSAYIDAKNDPEYKPVQEAYDAWQDAVDVAAKALQAIDDSKEGIKELWDALDEAFATQADDLGMSANVNYWRSYPTWTAVNDYLYNDADKPADAIAPMMLTAGMLKDFGVRYSGQEPSTVYINAKSYVVLMSAVAYGELSDSDDPAGLEDQAVLVDAVTPAMINDYIIKNYTGFDSANPEDYDVADLYSYYPQFGAYGETLYLQNRIDVAKAMLANADLAQTNIDAMKANLATMAASLKAAQEDAQEAENAVEAAEKRWDACFDEVEAKEEELNEMTPILENIVGALNIVVVTLNNQQNPDGQITKNEDAVKAIANGIESVERQLVQKNDELSGINAAYERATYQMEQYDSLQDVVSAAELAVEYQTSVVNRYQIEVEYLKTRVDDLTKEYEAAMGKTAAE